MALYDMNQSKVLARSMAADAYKGSENAAKGGFYRHV